jgi:P27 family predicted phage terminase small subunit
MGNTPSRSPRRRGEPREDAGTVRTVPPLTQVPPPPRELSRDARKIWRRVARNLVASRRVSSLDLDQLEIYCDARVKLRRAAQWLEAGLLLPGRRDDFRTSPVWKIYRDLLATCRFLGADLGLTPGARERFMVGLPQDEASDSPAPAAPPGAESARSALRSRAPRVGRRPAIGSPQPAAAPEANSSSTASAASACIEGSTCE